MNYPATFPVFSTFSSIIVIVSLNKALKVNSIIHKHFNGSRRLTHTTYNILKLLLFVQHCQIPTYYKFSWTYWTVESQVQVFIFWNFHYKQNFFWLFVINVFVWIWWYRPLSFCNVSHTGFGYLERKPSDCCKFGKSYFVSLIGRMIENLLMCSSIVTCFIIYFP